LRGPESDRRDCPVERTSTVRLAVAYDHRV
jgi:hypothetical protein